jgi:hypothetical protein
MQRTLNLIADDRHAERYRARPRLRISGGTRRAPRPASARDRAGWLLVGLGMRLLAGRGGLPPAGLG